MDNRFYVYLISRQNGRPCYVGKGIGRRWRKHEWRSTNPHLANIYAQAGGTLPRVKIAENLSETEAHALEIKMIATIGREAHGGPLVNLTDGGEGVVGFKMPKNIVDRVAAINRGNQYCVGVKASEEARAAMRAAKLGKKQSPETIEKRAMALRGRKRSAEICAKISAGKRGKKASEETKIALRAANRSRDPEVRARISEATKRAMARTEVRAKIEGTFFGRSKID